MDRSYGAQQDRGKCAEADRSYGALLDRS
jgi:hypothetical protein